MTAAAGGGGGLGGPSCQFAALDAAGFVVGNKAYFEVGEVEVEGGGTAGAGVGQVIAEVVVGDVGQVEGDSA